MVAASVERRRLSACDRRADGDRTSTTRIAPRDGVRHARTVPRSSSRRALRRPRAAARQRARALRAARRAGMHCRHRRPDLRDPGGAFSDAPVPARTFQHRAVLDPTVFKAYDVRGIYPDRARRGRRVRDRARVRRAVRAARIAVGRDMRVSSPSMAAALIDGAADGGADVLDLGMVGTEMVYFAVGELGLDGGICVTASHNPKQYTGMKIVRARRAAGGRRLGPAGRARPGARGRSGTRTARGTRRAQAGHLARVRRQGAVVRRRRRDQAAAGRDRRGQRHGRRDAAAGARAAADRRRHAATSSRTGRFPNHEPNPLLPENREFIVAQDARGARRPRGRVRRRRRPLLLRRRHRRVRPRRLRHRAARRVDPRRRSPAAKIIYDVRASWAVPETIERGRRRAADQPRRPRLHQAPHARGGRRLRRRGLRRTTTSATSRRPTPASSRSCSCSS